MTYKYFSYNGQVSPSDQAHVPLSSIEYSYGYGVYETIRVNGGVAFFMNEHSERLLNSASIIGLNHNITQSYIIQYIKELLKYNEVADCNIKVLLIGGPQNSVANLYIQCLNPLFLDRRLYKNGIKTITYKYERELPAAKSLNMLISYIAYRDASQVGAYDALLLNRKNCITEGTRTNFFGLSGNTIISPPIGQILPGVTRAKVIEVARSSGFEVIEEDINLNELTKFDNTFLTSTSSKILPISAIDKHNFGPPNACLKHIMREFNSFLDEYKHNAVKV